MNSFISLYYIIISILFFNIIPRLSYFNYSKQAFSLLNMIETNLTFNQQSATLLVWIVVLLSLLMAYFRKRILAIVLFILIYIFFSFLYSLGKVNHPYHIWLISSLLMCFLNFKSNLETKRNMLVLRLIQATALSHYFISGFWKLRKVKDLFSFKVYEETALEHLAYAAAEGSQLKDFVIYLIYNHQSLIGVAFISVLIFQISCVIPIVTERYYSLFGVMAIVFHVTTGIVLGISFKATIAAVLFLLIIVEELILKRPNFITSLRKKIIRD